MLGYALTRIAVALGLIWAVVTLVFLIIHFVPGDPAELLLSQGGVAPDPAAVVELREKLGLDRPLLAQYLGYVGGLLKGDLGSSLLDDHSVVDEIALRLPRTLELIFAASLIAVLFGLPLSTVAALRAGSPVDAGLALATRWVLGGTVLVVVGFNCPALSGYLVRAVEQRDYPEVVGIVLVISVAFVVINLVVDLLYAVIDPRVRHG